MSRTHVHRPRPPASPWGARLAPRQDANAAVTTKGLAQLLDALAKFNVVPVLKPSRPYDLEVRVDPEWRTVLEAGLKSDEVRFDWAHLTIGLPANPTTWTQGLELYSDRTASAWLRRHVLAMVRDLGLPVEEFRRPA